MWRSYEQIAAFCTWAHDQGVEIKYRASLIPVRGTVTRHSFPLAAHIALTIKMSHVCKAGRDELRDWWTDQHPDDICSAWVWNRMEPHDLDRSTALGKGGA